MAVAVKWSTAHLMGRAERANASCGFNVLHYCGCGGITLWQIKRQMSVLIIICLGVWRELIWQMLVHLLVEQIIISNTTLIHFIEHFSSLNYCSYFTKRYKINKTNYRHFSYRLILVN